MSPTSLLFIGESLLSRLDTAPNLERTKTKGEGFMQIRGKPCLWMGITERVILGREDNFRTVRGKVLADETVDRGVFLNLNALF